MANWSFLTNHARVLLCVAHDPGVRLRDIAASLDITERGAFGILTDLAEATAAHATEAQRGSGQRAVLVAGQAREAVTAGRAEATAANAWAESASAEVERMRQDDEHALGELRASRQRERGETAARLAAALQAAQTAATQPDEERTTHAAAARAGAEPERVRADSTREREELRQVPDGRASVLEEARAELPARAGRAVREPDQVRAERAERGRA